MPSPTERIDDLIAKTPDWQAKTLAKLREVIHDADHQVTGEWKWVTARRPGASVSEHNSI